MPLDLPQTAIHTTSHKQHVKMFNSELQKMYQAWQQGNENYVCDWYAFVEYAANWNRETAEKTLEQLSKCRWFKKGD